MGSAKIVVGLGNPGKAYEHTPHNAGFKVIDELAGRSGCALRRSFRLKARFGKAFLADKEVWLVKPTTFVNNSGLAVAAVLRKSGASVADLVVVLDDADLDAGQLRIRRGGGAGGHNGLKSVINHVGGNDFIRVRLGIGRDSRDDDLARHVLKPLSAGEREDLKAETARAADAVVAIIERGAERAMNDFNTREGRGGNTKEKGG